VASCYLPDRGACVTQSDSASSKNFHPVPPILSSPTATCRPQDVDITAPHAPQHAHVHHIFFRLWQPRKPQYHTPYPDAPSAPVARWQPPLGSHRRGIARSFLSCCAAEKPPSSTVDRAAVPVRTGWRWIPGETNYTAFRRSNGAVVHDSFPPPTWRIIMCRRTPRCDIRRPPPFFAQPILMSWSKGPAEYGVDGVQPFFDTTPAAGTRRS